MLVWALASVLSFLSLVRTLLYVPLPEKWTWFVGVCLPLFQNIHLRICRWAASRRFVPVISCTNSEVASLYYLLLFILCKLCSKHRVFIHFTQISQLAPNCRHTCSHYFRLLFHTQVFHIAPLVLTPHGLRSPEYDLAICPLPLRPSRNVGLVCGVPISG